MPRAGQRIGRRAGAARAPKPRAAPPPGRLPRRSNSHGDRGPLATRARPDRRRACHDRIDCRQRLPRRGRRQLGLPLRRPPRRQRRRDPRAAPTGLSGPAEGVPLHLEPLGLPCRRRAGLRRRGRGPVRKPRAAASRVRAEQVRRRGPGARGAGARPAGLDTSAGPAHRGFRHRRLAARRPRVLALQGLHPDGDGAGSRLADRRGPRRRGGAGHRASLDHRPPGPRHLSRERAAGAPLARVRPLDEPVRLPRLSRALRPLGRAARAGRRVGRPRPPPDARLLSEALVGWRGRAGALPGDPQQRSAERADAGPHLGGRSRLPATRRGPAGALLRRARGGRLSPASPTRRVGVGRRAGADGRPGPRPLRADTAPAARGRLGGRDRGDTVHARLRAQHRRRAHRLAAPWTHRTVSPPPRARGPARRAVTRRRHQDQSRRTAR